MPYTPDGITSKGIRDAAPGATVPVGGPAIFRELKITDAKMDETFIVITVDGFNLPLRISRGQRMTFGTETITAEKYFKRTLENGDLIDVVLHPVKDGFYPAEALWISIRYVGTRSATGTFSAKEDGHFAMRTKAGEKAERIVARELAALGHDISEGKLVPPGFFEIRYAGKTLREVDITCASCGLSLEVKKRNADQKFRISHSVKRPFSADNKRSGWHAFVFPDMKPRYVRNADILKAIEDGNTTPAGDRYDMWSDVDPDVVTVEEAPSCQRHPKPSAS